MTAIILALEILVYGSFFWAGVFFFRVEEEGAKTGKIVYAGVGTLSFVSLLYGGFVAEHLPVSLAVISACLLLISASIFWSTLSITSQIGIDWAGSEREPQTIFSGGPYKLVRHPFYTAYLIFWIAAATATGSWLYFVFPSVLGAMYFRSASKEEQILSTGPTADRYQKYKDNTGFFFPKVG